MKTFSKSLFLTLLMLALAGWLLCQVEDTKPVPNDSTLVLEDAQHMMALLLDKDYEAEIYINWDDLYLNDDYLGDEYRDSYDYYLEDIYIEEIIDEISGLLHYEGDTDDPYTNWTVEQKDNWWRITCNNRVKWVEMIIDKLDDGYFYLSELYINNVEK